ncbi:MAG TPA: hypothetical protein VGI91_01575 [Steroidobacteraceae bacterium]|jgi:membrane protein CcdC involved in cytochrome C biogenesis
MPQHAPFPWVTVALVAFIGWRVYVRFRRSIGRQRFVAARSWLSVTVLPLLLASVAWGLRFQPPVMGLSLASGLLLGVALGVLGLRLTRFEVAGDGLYYVPSAHLGIALSTLLVARIGYRYVAATAAGSAPAAPMGMHLTPLTLGLVGTVVGYYGTYAAGLLRWSVRQGRTQGAGLRT